MIFAVFGLLKQPAPPTPPGFEAAVNEHFAQPFLRIINAGYLHDAKGERRGVMGLVECDSFEKAEAFLRSSPFVAADAYERFEVVEYRVEVGRTG